MEQPALGGGAVSIMQQVRLQIEAGKHGGLRTRREQLLSTCAPSDLFETCRFGAR